MSKVLLGFVVLHLHIIEVYYYVSILSTAVLLTYLEQITD